MLRLRYCALRMTTDKKWCFEMCGIGVQIFNCPILICEIFIFDDRRPFFCCRLLQGEPGAMGLPGLEGLPGAKVSNPDFQKIYPPMFQTEIKTCREKKLPDVYSKMLMARSQEDVLKVLQLLLLLFHTLF